MNYKDCCGPDPNPMSLVEAEALRRIMNQLPPNPVIIQIGAERGASTLAMLDARKDAFIFSIDCGAREEEFENLKKANLPWKRVVRGLGYSQNIGQAWPWKADMVFIDGDHRRPAIDNDIKLWAQHTTDWLVFHDYIPPKERPSHIVGRVWEAVEEWDSSSFEEAFLVHRLKAYRRKDGYSV